MRTLLIFSSVVVFSWLSLGSTYGQTSPDSVTTSVGKTNYRFALGVRKSVTGDNETSLSGKYFLTPNAALHLTGGRVIGPGRSAISVAYERYHSLWHSARFRYFYGAGLSTVNFHSDTESISSRTRLYGNALLGIEYTCKTIPLAFSADGRILFRGLRPADWKKESVQNIGVSVHYLLK